MRGVEAACFRAWRSALLEDAAGTVLEIGAGTGLNLEHYPAGAGPLVLCEPDPGMRRQLAARVGDRTDVEVRPDPGEALDMAAGAVDTVVSTLVLCSVRDVGATLAEVHRVLRPGGQLLFMEHVAAAPGSDRRWWQERVEPVWRRIAGNCHLTRETEGQIVDAGFTLASCTHESVRKALPIVRPSIRGLARKPDPSR